MSAKTLYRTCDVLFVFLEYFLQFEKQYTCTHLLRTFLNETPSGKESIVLRKTGGIHSLYCEVIRTMCKYFVTSCTTILSHCIWQEKHKLTQRYINFSFHCWTAEYDGTSLSICYMILFSFKLLPSGIL